MHRYICTIIRLLGKELRRDKDNEEMRGAKRGTKDKLSFVQLEQMMNKGRAGRSHRGSTPVWYLRKFC